MSDSSKTAIAKNVPCLIEMLLNNVQGPAVAQSLWTFELPTSKIGEAVATEMIMFVLFYVQMVASSSAT